MRPAPGRAHVWLHHCRVRFARVVTVGCDGWLEPLHCGGRCFRVCFDDRRVLRPIRQGGQNACRFQQFAPRADRGSACNGGAASVRTRAPWRCATSWPPIVRRRNDQRVVRDGRTSFHRNVDVDRRAGGRLQLAKVAAHDPRDSAIGQQRLVQRARGGRPRRAWRAARCGAS